MVSSVTEKMIQKPYLLAEVQQDLTGLHGNVLASDVVAVAGSRKRKRSELALAVDRQGIKVYDVSLCSVFEGYCGQADKVIGPVIETHHILCDITPSRLYMPTILYSIAPARR